MHREKATHAATHCNTLSLCITPAREGAMHREKERTHARERKREEERECVVVCCRKESVL